MVFVCIRKCQYREKIYNEGQKIDVKPVYCPECEGKGCEKCKMCGRIDPPRHFEPVEKVEAPAVAPVVPVAEKVTVIDPDAVDPRDAIRAEIRELGGDYVPQWGMKKLEEKLLTLKKEKGV